MDLCNYICNYCSFFCLQFFYFLVACLSRLNSLIANKALLVGIYLSILCNQSHTVFASLSSMAETYDAGLQRYRVFFVVVVVGLLLFFNQFFHTCPAYGHHWPLPQHTFMRLCGWELQDQQKIKLLRFIVRHSSKLSDRNFDKALWMFSHVLIPLEKLIWSREVMDFTGWGLTEKFNIGTRFYWLGINS